jgi:hypothetical protein
MSSSPTASGTEFGHPSVVILITPMGAEPLVAGWGPILRPGPQFPAEWRRFLLPGAAVSPRRGRCSLREGAGAPSEEALPDAAGRRGSTRIGVETPLPGKAPNLLHRTAFHPGKFREPGPTPRFHPPGRVAMIRPV